MLVSSSEFSAREFLVYEEVRWTYGEHLALVVDLAHALRVRGVAKGDRVAIAMRNFPEWSVAFWAAQALGAAVVPLNAWWLGVELAFAYSHSGAQVLIADRGRFDRIEPLLDSLLLRSVIVVRDEQGELPPGVEHWGDVGAASPGLSLPDALVEADDISTIVYTSGTTGTPKGAVHLHRNHCTSVMNNLLFMEVGRVMGATPPDRSTSRRRSRRHRCSRSRSSTSPVSSTSTCHCHRDRSWCSCTAGTWNARST